jgi:cytochrome c oxidase assembly protein subunit 15
MNPGAKAERLARLVGALAALAAALTLLVITVSAVLRLAQAGLGCEPWPQCYGISLATSWLDPVRATHRISALAVAVVVLMIFVLAASGGRAAVRLVAIAGAALAVIAFLTWVGIITPGTRLPAVALANLVGGMTLLALLWWLFLEARGGGKGSTGAVGASALIAVLLLVAQIGLGALAHATLGSASCPTLAGCALSDWLPQVSATAFAPFRPIAGVAGHSLPHPDAVAVHMTHRVLALVVTAWLLMVAWQAWRIRATRSSGMVLAAALVLQVATGALLVVLRMPLVAAVVHNVAASLLLAALLLVVLRLRDVR